MKYLPLTLSCLVSLTGLAACTQSIGPALASSANATSRCDVSAPQSLALDLAGIEAVRFEVGRHTLHLEAGAQGDGQLSGRGCASNEELLKGLRIAQTRRGSTLVVHFEQDNAANVFLGNSKGRYAWLDMTVTLPSGFPVALALSSGKTVVRHVPALNASVSSGDLDASDITGDVTLALSSGNARLADIGPLSATVSSGNLIARDVAGPTRLTVSSGDAVLERIGALTATLSSGDLRVTQTAGPVDLSVASGEAELTNLKGDLRIGQVSSGEVDAREVAGAVTVDRLGSGDIRLRQIGGAVAVDTISSGRVSVEDAASLTVSRLGRGDIDHSRIRGTVTRPATR